jgi:chitin synthase
MYMFSDFSRFFWWLLPLSILRNLVDFIEIHLIIIFYIIRRFQPQPTPKVPATPESFVYLLCCYNETYQELMNSLDSLAEQKSVDGHKKAIIVVCDGRESGRGSPGTHMRDEIIERPSSTIMPAAYTSWDGASMDAEIVKGEFRGLPIICITKNENRGKRDGIILVRSFLHKFNQRDSKPSLGMLSPALFSDLTGFLQKASIQSVDYAVGIDADTRFDPECVTNMIQTVREGDQIVGVTASIRVDPKTLAPFSIAYLYQSAEYIIGQHRRRLRQGITSRRVTCLPGCCQLLRVTEKTCGDFILAKFGYYPRDTDGLFRTVRSMMSEDRDHICLVLSEYADVETRVCLSSRAYTSAPHSLSVFLSQRRRWTLGPLTSDSLLVSRRSTGWMERVAAATSVLHWLVNPALFISRFYRTYHCSCK